MKHRQRSSRWRRALRWCAGAALAAGVALWAWVAFFPVPLGWAVRLGLARALPAGGPLRVAMEEVVFRWRWGEPLAALEVRGLDASAQGRPLARWRELIVEVPKAGLWRRQFAPGRILLRDPVATLDQTAEGALALLASPKPAGPAAPLDLSPLGPVLPAPGAATRVVIEGATMHLRNAAGAAQLPVGPLRATLAREPAGSLTLELDLPLSRDGAAPRLTARAALEPRSLRGDFSLALPAFSTDAIPALPGAPPLPFQGVVALDASGHLDLLGPGVVDAAVGLTLTNARIVAPREFAAEDIRLDQLELRGRMDAKTRRVVLERGRVRAGALELDVGELDAALGDRPQARWQLEARGLKGADVRRLLARQTRARLPLTDEAIDALALDRLTLSGRGEVAQDTAGVWSAQAMELKGEATFALGPETLACAWSARQAKQGGDIQLEVTLPAFTPGRWPAALIAGTPAGWFDLPLSLTAQAAVTAAGEPRAARLTFSAGSGSVKPAQGKGPAIEVRRLEVQAESDRFDRAWRIPAARLELTEGARLELVNFQAELGAAQMAAEGETRLANLSGDFLSRWLPAETWAPLTARQLPPRAVALDELVVRFKAAAAAAPSKGWQPTSMSAEATAKLRLNAARLALAARATLPEPGASVDASVTVEEFQPAQLGLVLAEGLGSELIEFPVSLRATARASLDGNLSRGDLELRAGAGRVKLPAALGDGAVPFKALALDASYEPAQGRAEVKSLRLEAAGLQVDLADVTATTAPPHAVNGRLELAPFSLRPLLEVWPARVQPELRRMAESALRGGDFLGGRFEGSVKFDPAAPTPLTIARLQGEARLAALDVVHAAVPGPVALGRLTATVDYPRATVELQDIAVPGARVTSARAQVDGLDRAAPAAKLEAKFETDLVAANRAWKFAPDDLATGTLGGELTVEAPLDLATATAGIALDLRRTKLKLPLPVKAIPDTIAARVSLAQPLAPDQPMSPGFSVETSAWLGAPMRVAGRARLSAATHQPEVIEVTGFDHGLTRLQASYRQPSALHREISVTGSYLDLGPLLRAGLAAADALAARPAAAAAPPVAAEDAPGTLRIDASLGEIAFGPGHNARAFELHTRLAQNWPAEFSLSSLVGKDDALNATLTGPLEHQVFKFSITDASVWMRTLAAPWNQTPPAPGQFGSLVLQLAKVPTIVAGGAVSLEADLRRGEPEWLSGRLQLRRAIMIRAPYVLQLLARKSGRSVQDSPTIEEFSIGKLALGKTNLTITDLTLTGSGLIDRIKLKSASYGLADEALKVDGEYFGVGFDILGTRADPKIFLKDSNPIIRAIGSRNEFDFDTAPPAPKPPAPK